MWFIGACGISYTLHCWIIEQTSKTQVLVFYFIETIEYFCHSFLLIFWELWKIYFKSHDLKTAEILALFKLHKRFQSDFSSSCTITEPLYEYDEWSIHVLRKLVPFLFSILIATTIQIIWFLFIKSSLFCLLFSAYYVSLKWLLYGYVSLRNLY